MKDLIALFKAAMPDGAVKSDVADSIGALNSEDECAELLVRLRWPDGFRCRRCGCGHAYRVAGRRLPLYECVRCKFQTSPIAGTVMEGSRTPLVKWFCAVRCLAQDGGITAKALARRIGVTYKTAWTILHKLRRAICEDDRKRKLTGAVRICDGEYRPLMGYTSSIWRDPREFPVLIGFSETSDGRPLAIKLKEVAKPSSDRSWTNKNDIWNFVEEHCEENARPVEISIGRFRAPKWKKALPFFLEARRWLREKFGGIKRKHRQAYWDEYAFRLNAFFGGDCVFSRLLVLCAQTRRTTYRQLVS